MRRTSSILIAHHFAPLCLKNLIRALFYAEDMQASTAAGENTNREPPSHYTNILPLSFRDKSSEGDAFFLPPLPARPPGLLAREANRFKEEALHQYWCENRHYPENFPAAIDRAISRAAQENLLFHVFV
jgi:hypothetical protein